MYNYSLPGDTNLYEGPKKQNQALSKQWYDNKRYYSSLYEGGATRQFILKSFNTSDENIT